MAAPYTTFQLLTTAATTLTASYVASNIGSVGGGEQARVYAIYTPKSGQSNRNLSLRIEVNPNGFGWFPLPIGSDGAASSNVVITQVYENEYKYLGTTGAVAYGCTALLSGGFGTGTQVRVKFKEDGSGNFGTVQVALDTYTIG